MDYQNKVFPPLLIPQREDLVLQQQRGQYKKKQNIINKNNKKITLLVVTWGVHGMFRFEKDTQKGGGS